MNAGGSGAAPSARIELRAVTYSYGPQLILDALTASFAQRSITAVLGPSGCGKTTFLKCMCGLLVPRSGEILLGNVTPQEAQERGYIGVAFQAPILLPWRSALSNVVLPLELLRRNGSAQENFAKELMREVELTDHLEKYPWQLSGGQEQRVGLARSLVTKPKYLFLDEPFGSLDGFTRDRLNQKVRDLAEKFGLTVLFVTHSIEEAVFLADRVVLFGGPPPTNSLTIIEVDLEVPRVPQTRLSERFSGLVKWIREMTNNLT